MYTVAKQGKMKSPASLSTSLDFYLNVFFLFPSSSPAILCALSSTSSNHRKQTPVSKIKLTSSPLAALPSETCFFSLRLWRIGVEGTVFPSYTVQIHSLAVAETVHLHRPHRRANTLTESQPQLPQCGRQQQIGLNWTAAGWGGGGGVHCWRSGAVLFMSISFGMS